MMAGNSLSPAGRSISNKPGRIMSHSAPLAWINQPVISQSARLRMVNSAAVAARQ